jgi:hypothetical protein
MNILSDTIEPTFQDAQAAEVLSSITTKSRSCQSPQGTITSHQLSSAESPNNATSTDWETSPPLRTNDVFQELLPSSIPVGGDATLSQHSSNFAQTADEWEQSPREEHLILEIANPLPSWQSKSHQDPLDWDTSFFTESLSNPLPPTGDAPSLDLVDWNNYT